MRGTSQASDDSAKSDQHSERIGIIVVAYNAASTLAAVLDRLPQSFRSRVAEVVVCDDASSDCTYTVGKEYQAETDLPLTIIRRPQNLGYGGNQKAAYRWSIDHGLDIVVMLHADGQYAPEAIEDLVAPFASEDCDAVFGSRLLDQGSARIGGMPLYKYVGNRVLSKFANAATGLDLSEWHSGYRAYRVQALADIPFESNTDGFDFDTEIILQLLEAKKKIVEVPIPTFYGNEICHVNGMGYAKDVVKDVLRYRVHKVGFGSGEMAFAEPEKQSKRTTAAHRKLLTWLDEGSPKRILDLNCSNGKFGELLRLGGHTVVGVDKTKRDGVGDRLDEFFEADLNDGLPVEVGTGYDVVIGTSVFERLAEPELLLAQLADVLAPRGVVMASVPNIAHWYPRAKMATGHFDYERRGIFDSDHLRFFTQKSFEQMANRAGMRVRRRSSAGLPVEVAERGGPSPSRLMNAVGVADRMGLALSPNLFSYQFVFELEPK
jgi:glycosyltransferase involved in cell wall biosynthesis